MGILNGQPAASLDLLADIQHQSALPNTAAAAQQIAALFTSAGARSSDSQIIGQLESILQFPPKSFALADLDRYMRVHTERAQNLANLLSEISPSQVSEKLGSWSLIWLKAHAHTFSQPQKIAMALALEEAGFDITLLERARQLELHFNANARESNLSCETILRWHQLLKSHSSTDLSPVLPRLISASSREGVSISAARAADYDIIPINTIGFQPVGRDELITQSIFKTSQGDAKADSFFLDAPLGLCLTYRELPQAIAAFYPTSSSTLRVVQIQGKELTVIRDEAQSEKRLRPRGLMPLRGLELMLRAAIEYAKVHGFSEIRVRPARDNPHSIHLSVRDSHHLQKPRAQQAYDQTAAALHFVLDHSGDWSMMLE